MPREDQIDKQYEDKFTPESLRKKEEEAGADQSEKADSANNDELRDLEQNQDNPNQFDYSQSSRATPKSTSARLTGFLKKAGPTTGIVGGVGIIGIILSTIFGPFTLLHNLQANGMFTNDTRSGMLERRLAKVLEKKMSNNDAGCDIKKFHCRQGKMPKKMLERLEQQGIVPTHPDGKPLKIEYDENGYAKENPGNYTIEGEVDKDGKLRTIKSSEFVNEYKRNPKFRATFKKAYNMRYKAWTGKFMSKNFFKKYSLKKNGGLAADEDLNEKTVDKKVDSKLKPSADGSEPATKQKFTERVRALLTKSARRAKSSHGDPILLAATGACIGLGIPRFVTGTVRAIQMIQILGLVNDLVISPAGKAKASEVTPDQMSAIGKKLTEQVDGKSALDSPILLSAIGVNTMRPAVSKLAPGYSILHNKGAQALNKISDATKSPCNRINSPAGQIVAGTISAAITTGTGGIGGLGLIALRVTAQAAMAFGAIEAALYLADKTGLMDLVLDLGWKIAQPLINEALNFVKDAKGMELGDVLGTGLLAFFSRGNLAGTGSVLKKEDVAAFRNNIGLIDDEEREEAIATLSPLDTTSRYTFMGSIIWSLNNEALISGNSLSSLVGSTFGFLKSPFSLLPQTVSAETDAAVNRCSYADDWGVDSDVAIDASGSPCSGIPAEYMNMSPDEVYDLAFDEGGNIDEVTGKIDPDGEIAMKLDECADGDLESVSGCTIDKSDLVPGDDSEYFSRQAAYSLYLLDNQVECVLNGGDDVDSNDPNCGGDDNSDQTQQQATTAKTGKLCSVNGINESSGASISLQDPDLLYTHNDEPGPIFGIKMSTCEIVSKFKLSGVSTDDTESIRIDSSGRLWLSDNGNNHPQEGEAVDKKKRAGIAIFNEPGAGFNGSQPAKYYTVSYPGGIKENVESLLINPTTQEPFVITKDKSGKVYSLPKYSEFSSGSSITASRVGGVTLPGSVSDATFTSDGRYILIRIANKNETLVYNANWQAVGSIPDGVSNSELPQVEAIAMDNDGTSFILTSETKKHGNGPMPLVRVALPEGYR